MPYSGASDPSIPKNVPSNKKAQWVKVWNSTYKSCTSDGGSKKKCETMAFKSANGVIKSSKRSIFLSEKRSSVMTTGLLGAINGLFVNMQNAFRSFQQRAVSIPMIGNAVWEKLYEQGAYLSDLYYEDGALFATASKGGKLHRAAVEVDDNGDVSVGDMQEVVISFDPVSRAIITRTEDGKVQMLSVSATSVLNKAGEIDSRDLFDSMSDLMSKTGNPVSRTFFHLGEEFKTGNIVFMGRDENVLVTLTEFDDSEIARQEIKSREDDPDYWGDSIEFDPVGEAELWDVGDGITIPVYRAGIPIAVSTVPAEHACSPYADRFSVKRQEVKRMSLTKIQREALIKMYKGDEAAVDAWLKEHVIPINRQIEDTNQVTRSKKRDDETPTEEPGDNPEETTEEEVSEEESTEEVVTEETDAEDEVVLEFTDEMALQVAETVVKSNTFTEFQSTITSVVDEIKSTVASLSTTVADLQAASVARAKEIDVLKKKDSVKKEEWLQDIPRSTRRTVSFRPSQNAPTEPEVEGKKRSMAEIAAETLANLE